MMSWTVCTIGSTTIVKIIVNGLIRAGNSEWHGFWSWVIMGTGTGTDSCTCELSNKPWIIKNGQELSYDQFDCFNHNSLNT
jgi:hypothetical protein